MKRSENITSILSCIGAVWFLYAGTALAATSMVPNTDASVGTSTVRARENRERLMVEADNTRERVEMRSEEAKQYMEMRMQEFKNRVHLVQDAMKKRLESLLTTHREEIRLKWQERRVKFSQEQKERVRAAADRAIKKYQHALDTLLDIALRLDERIADFEARGANVEDVRAKLAIANENIARAQALFDSAKGKLLLVSTAENPGQAMEEVKLVFGEVKTSIHDTREALSVAIAALKMTSANNAQINDSSTSTSSQ